MTDPKMLGEVTLSDGRIVRVMPVSPGIVIEIEEITKLEKGTRRSSFRKIYTAEEAQAIIRALREIGWI